MQIKIFLFVILDRQVALETFIVWRNEKKQRIPVLLGTPVRTRYLMGEIDLRKVMKKDLRGIVKKHGELTDWEIQQK